MQQARKNLELLINNDIHLDKDCHIYFSQSNSTDMYLISVTGVIEKQFKPFNKMMISKWLANNTQKYAHLTAEQIRQQWDDQKNKATRIHHEIEKYIKSGNQPMLKYAKNGVSWFEEENKNFGNECFSEVIVFSDEHEIAGTIDLLIYNEEKDGCYIFDWKTTNKMNDRGKNYGIKNATKNIKDSKFNTYELQLSFYRYLLQEMHGIKVLRQYILHIEPDDVNCISCNYKKNTITSILNSFEKNLSDYLDYDDTDNSSEPTKSYTPVTQTRHVQQNSGCLIWLIVLMFTLMGCISLFIF